jgi:hypothetical protein
MHFVWMKAGKLSLLLLLQYFSISCPIKVLATGQYLNEWLLQVPEGLPTATSLADQYGFHLVKQVCMLIFIEDFSLF